MIVEPETETTESAATRLSELPRHGRLSARFDAASDTPNNARHWAESENSSADMENNPDARQRMRQRCRHEAQNNSYARGITLSIANDIIGTGPRLQMDTGDNGLDSDLELAFAAWATEVKFAEKLRTHVLARMQDGEAFLHMYTNEKHESPVQLDVRLVEADRVASPLSQVSESENDREIDGVKLDEFDNPVSYRVLKHHPASMMGLTDKGDIIEAKDMIHVFRVDRPGQHRGIPELAACLTLFAQLRRYTLAVLSAAEVAASFAGVIYTDNPVDGESAKIEPMDLIDLERNMLVTMPAGWKMGQIDAIQPTATYAEFKGEILSEIARCLLVPYNVAAGDSSKSNYASGRMDKQSYYKAIAVGQDFIRQTILDRIVAKWLREYCLTSNITLTESQKKHKWFWDGTEHVDPAKEASAQETHLRTHTTTLAAEYAKKGLDWQVELEQAGKEKKKLIELGLVVEVEDPVVEKANDGGGDGKDDE